MWPDMTGRGEPTVFKARVTGFSQGGQIWVKPPGVSFVYIIAIAGGGGGAGGAGTPPNAGGAGGGPSAYTALLMPAKFVPEALEIIVGMGGAGAASGVSTSTAGSPTQILSVPNRQVLFTVNAGAAATNPTGGASGAVSSETPWTRQGFMSSVTGGAGGGFNAASTAGITTGGGGGADNAAGLASTAPLGFANAAGGANTPAAGSGGYTRLTGPFITVGGGAGGSAAASGANGGPGGIGCGGGGGGGSNGVDGAGGRGGDGIVLIWAW